VAAQKLKEHAGFRYGGTRAKIQSIPGMFRLSATRKSCGYCSTFLPIMPWPSRREFDLPRKCQRATPSWRNPVSAQIASIVIAQIK
jgi:hypothetical protein